MLKQLNPWIPFILSSLLVICITILIMSLTKGRQKPDPFYKASIDLIQQSISLLEKTYAENNQLHTQLLKEKDQAKSKADSLLLIVINNQPKYTNLNNAYKNIPGNISRISADDTAIQRAFATY